MANRKTIVRWTPDELQYLKDNYLTMDNREMAAELKRTQNAVALKLHQINLRRNKSKIAPIEHCEKIKPSTPDKCETQPAPKQYSVSKETPPSTVKDFFIIDFSSHENLYDSLIDLSKENFRTPENQILYLIHKAIDEQTVKQNSMAENRH